MSKEFDRGYQAGCDNYGPIKLKDWRTMAYAEGWLYGLECLLDNYHETETDEYTTQEYLDKTIKECESWIDDTQMLIDQVSDGKDHKNQIQTLCNKIEELHKIIAEMEEGEY